MTVMLRKGKMIGVPKRKLTLLSISKDENRERYEFEKKQEFFPFLLDFLLKLGFDRRSTYLENFFGISQEEDQPINEDYYTKDPFSQKYLDIKGFNETFATLKNERYDIEVIIFSSKIFLVIRKKDKNRVNLGEMISEYALFRNELKK